MKCENTLGTGTCRRLPMASGRLRTQYVGFWSMSLTRCWKWHHHYHQLALECRWTWGELGFHLDGTQPIMYLLIICDAMGSLWHKTFRLNSKILIERNCSLTSFVHPIWFGNTGDMAKLLWLWKTFYIVWLSWILSPGVPWKTIYERISWKVFWRSKQVGR